MRREGRVSCRSFGSSVANIRSDASTSAPVRLLNSVDFPAFVYPTSATVGTGTASRRPRCCRLIRRTASSCARMRSSRTLINRRSVSSFVSPGPRVPIPPPSCDIDLPLPGKPRQLILQLRQLDLQHTLASPRMASKDVQNQLRPVDHRARQPRPPRCGPAKASGHGRTARDSRPSKPPSPQSHPACRRPPASPRRGVHAAESTPPQ